MSLSAPVVYNADNDTRQRSVATRYRDCSVITVSRLSYLGRSTKNSGASDNVSVREIPRKQISRNARDVRAAGTLIAGDAYKSGPLPFGHERDKPRRCCAGAHAGIGKRRSARQRYGLTSMGTTTFPDYSAAFRRRATSLRQLIKLIVLANVISGSCGSASDCSIDRDRIHCAGAAG